MFGLNKKKSINLKQRDFAKLATQARQNSAQFAKVQQQFAKLVKHYSSHHHK